MLPLASRSFSLPPRSCHPPCSCPAHLAAVAAPLQIRWKNWAIVAFGITGAVLGTLDTVQGSAYPTRRGLSRWPSLCDAYSAPVGTTLT
jgi:hypothetical protein